MEMENCGYRGRITWDRKDRGWLTGERARVSYSCRFWRWGDGEEWGPGGGDYSKYIL